MAEILTLLGLAGAVVLFVRWLWREEALPPKEAAPGGARALTATTGTPERVLFVCTHNSARSQMAEAWLRALAGERFDVASAGTAPTRVHPLAVQGMTERGVSLQTARAKGLTEVGTRWDYVITVCDAAFEQCPEFSAKTSRLHWSVEDPSQCPGPFDAQLAAFRRVRDDLAARIAQWVAERLEKD